MYKIFIQRKLYIYFLQYKNNITDKNIFPIHGVDKLLRFLGYILKAYLSDNAYLLIFYGINKVIF